MCSLDLFLGRRPCMWKGEALPFWSVTDTITTLESRSGVPGGRERTWSVPCVCVLPVPSSRPELC